MRTAVQPPKWFNDDFAYHATNVVQWVFDERLSLGSFNDHAYWPLNTALLPLWLVLPFRTDAMAVWSATPWLLLSSVALVGIARAQRLDWSVGLMAAAMTVASPGIAWMLRTFSAADFSGPAMLLAAVAFLAPANAGNERARGLQWAGSRVGRVNAVFAGMASGFAVGTKIPFAFAVLTLGLWILLEHSTERLEKTRRAALFTAGVITTGSYWYIRNWILTGNPLFPGKLGPFDGPMTLDNSQPTLLEWMLRPPPPNAWQGFFEAYIGSWSYGLAFLALIAFLYSIRTWSKRNKTDVDGTVFLLSICFFVLLVTHPFMPVSGPYPVDAPHPQFVPRYINSVFLMGMALATSLLGAQGRMKWVWWSYAAISLGTAWQGPVKILVPVAIVSMLVFGFSSYLFRRAPTGLIQPATLCAAVAVLAGGAAGLAGHTQTIVDRYIFDGYSDMPVGKGWQALDQFPAVQKSHGSITNIGSTIRYMAGVGNSFRYRSIQKVRPSGRYTEAGLPCQRTLPRRQRRT